MEKKVINDFVGGKKIVVVVIRDDGTVRFFSKDKLPEKTQQVMFSIKN